MKKKETHKIVILLSGGSWATLGSEIREENSCAALHSSAFLFRRVWMGLEPTAKAQENQLLLLFSQHSTRTVALQMATKE